MTQIPPPGVDSRPLPVGAKVPGDRRAWSDRDVVAHPHLIQGQATAMSKDW